MFGKRGGVPRGPALKGAVAESAAAAGRAADAPAAETRGRDDDVAANSASQRCATAAALATGGPSTYLPDKGKDSGGKLVVCGRVCARSSGSGNACDGRVDDEGAADESVAGRPAADRAIVAEQRAADECAADADERSASAKSISSITLLVSILCARITSIASCAIKTCGWYLGACCAAGGIDACGRTTHCTARCAPGRRFVALVPGQ